MSSTKTIVLFACVSYTCLVSSISSARNIRPTHGWYNYEPYQLQQEPEYESRQYQANSDSIAYKLPATSATRTAGHRLQQRAQHPSGDHHTDSGHGVEDSHDDHHSHPKYQFAYNVEEHKTGDYKRHEEERDGDVVKGEYALMEADGSIRTVKYTVDKDSGFQAVVVKSEPSKSRR